MAKNSSTCVVLVLKEYRYYEIGNGESEKPYYSQYAVPSKQFWEEFGEISWKRRFSSDHPFTAVVYDPDSPEIYEGEVELANRNGEIVVLNFEAWSNTYNIFVLIYKKPKISFPKKKVSLLNMDGN